MRLRNSIRAIALVFALSSLLGAQTSALTWKRIGGTFYSEGLAGPSTGAVRAVWFGEGGRLYATTTSGRIFETSDFEHWKLNSSVVSPGSSDRAGDTRIYIAARDNVYSSSDSGKTWINLTGFNNRSILGGGFASIALAPSDSQHVAVANEHGVWRSLDGGLSWHSLNTDLPNLPVRKLLARRTVMLERGSIVALEAGLWNVHDGSDPDADLIVEASRRSGLRIIAAARAGANIYGALADGRIAASRDGGLTWSATTATPAALQSVPPERVWAAAARPESALVSVAGHLFRTVNAGLFWDDVTAGLPATAIHGMAADVSASVVYVATDRGVYMGTLSLNDAGPVSPNWKLVTADLPAAPAWDVRLNGDNTLTVALEGYGVYETAALHKARSVRVVNGADMSDRPAAPGSLITVLGASVRQGRIGSLPYPVIAVAEDSSQLQVPFESTAGVYQIALEGTGDRWSVPLTVKESAPAIFVDSEGSPLLLDSESGLVLDSKVAVRAGSVLQMLATGLGRVTPEWASGVPAPLDSPPAVRGTVTAFIDGTPVEVTKATLAPGYVGYYLVEVRIPKIVNRGAGELRIVMNGDESNRVRLFLEPDLQPTRLAR